jgi:hypothetical protein
MNISNDATFYLQASILQIYDFLDAVGDDVPSRHKLLQRFNLKSDVFNVLLLNVIEYAEEQDNEEVVRVAKGIVSKTRTTSKETFLDNYKNDERLVDIRFNGKNTSFLHSLERNVEHGDNNAVQKSEIVEEEKREDILEGTSSEDVVRVDMDTTDDNNTVSAENIKEQFEDKMSDSEAFLKSEDDSFYVDMKKKLEDKKKHSNENQEIIKLTNEDEIEAEIIEPNFIKKILGSFKKSKKVKTDKKNIPKRKIKIYYLLFGVVVLLIILVFGIRAYNTGKLDSIKDKISSFFTQEKKEELPEIIPNPTINISLDRNAKDKQEKALPDLSNMSFPKEIKVSNQEKKEINKISENELEKKDSINVKVDNKISQEAEKNINKNLPQINKKNKVLEQNESKEERLDTSIEVEKDTEPLVANEPIVQAVSSFDYAETELKVEKVKNKQKTSKKQVLTSINKLIEENTVRKVVSDNNKLDEVSLDDYYTNKMDIKLLIKKNMFIEYIDKNRFMYDEIEFKLGDVFFGYKIIRIGKTYIKFQDERSSSTFRKRI